MADNRCIALQGAPTCCWGSRRKSKDGPHKRGLNTKIHLAVDAHGMPLRAIITEGSKHDSTQAGSLIEGIPAEILLADKAYDAEAIVQQAIDQKMLPNIPNKKNRKHPRTFDADLYKLRHLAENAFLHLKRWRGIATRYAKNASSFLAAVRIRYIALWANL